MPSPKFQVALGRNFKTSHGALLLPAVTQQSVGQAVIDSVVTFVTRQLKLDDGEDLVTSIHSANLRSSALFSARAARTAYVLGKVLLLDKRFRRGIVRTQVIEYGAVAEAIVLDLTQSIGKHNKPIHARTLQDERGASINWHSQGLFAHDTNGRTVHRYSFRWLIAEAERVGALDKTLSKRAHDLRESRNLVHPVIPIGQRYTDDLDNGRTARETVVQLRDASISFKKKHGLP